jgi:uncharacterized protein YgiM (DUF1202 family)
MHVTDQAMIHRGSRLGALFVYLALMLTWATGCSRFHGGVPAEYVYVTVKQMYLRDRVAVVADRVAMVTNGERLRVLEHGRHFLKVQTPQGNVGWLEAHAVIDQSEFDKFQELARDHAKQPAVATAVLFSEMYTHISPGRKTQRFYIFPENTKVSLLVRASVPRTPQGGISGLPSAAPVRGRNRAPANGRVHKQSFEKQFLPAVPMEDWWLVRDSTGKTGWMVSRDLQVDVPQEVAQYAENEKMVGAYVLRTVSDPDSGKPGGQVPEYLTVLTPYKDGLPFDFDQVRVFTWDVRRHRYGTAFRLHDVAGFFPVTVIPGDPKAPGGPSPEFSFQQAIDNAVSLDPVTGISHANQLETITYRLEGNLVRRVLPAGEKASPNEARARNVRSVRRRRHTHSR